MFSSAAERVSSLTLDVRASRSFFLCHDIVAEPDDF
jgi:hypothetical protein